MFPLCQSQDLGIHIPIAPDKFFNPTTFHIFPNPFIPHSSDMCLAITTEKGQQDPLTKTSYYHTKSLESWKKMSK